MGEIFLVPTVRRYVGPFYLVLCCISLSTVAHSNTPRNLVAVTNETQLHRAARMRSRLILLPPFEIVLSRPLILEEGGAIGIRGVDGSSLTMAASFQGSAAVHLVKTRRVLLENFEIRGNRTREEVRREMPPHSVAFRDHFVGNGVLVDRSADTTIRNLDIRQISGFAILASAVVKLSVDGVLVSDSGSLNSMGRNNTSGGILIEEGSSEFRVSNCKLYRVLGNGIWTHSVGSSPQNARGSFEGNYVEETARDAFQAGHAIQLAIVRNRGWRIGFPADKVDIENLAVPVAIDTAGNVERSNYDSNMFSDVNGTCINLDGFHDGVVQGNSCRNLRPIETYPHLHFGIVLDNSNPSMESKNIRIAQNEITGAAYGGLYLIGRNHSVIGNIFRDVNLAHCTGAIGSTRCNYELANPGLLRSGIFLAGGGNRPDPATGNTIMNNHVTGYRTREWCIEAGGGVEIDSNFISGNLCIDAIK